MNEVWVVMYTEENTGSDSVIGMFDTKEQATYFVGQHVLANELDTSYLELFSKKVEVDMR